MLITWLHRARSIRLAALQLIGAAVMVGIIIGASAHGPGGMHRIFALLLLSAGVVAVIQQTLP
jgi:hypothetical protein